MDFRDSKSEEAFRNELRSWLEANIPGEARRSGGKLSVDESKRWSKALHEAGYAGITWPKEYGGAGAPYTHQAIFLEEIARADAPEHVGVIGLGMAGPTIIVHGTPEQKSRHLAAILSGDDVWCQGFSEPGAGSDLAALGTKAEDDGDSFVVNGQKV